jgi:hypothetical protein
MATRRAIFMSISFSDGALTLHSWNRPHMGDLPQLSGDTRLGDNGELKLHRMA